MDNKNNKDLLAIFFDLDNTLIPTRIADTAACNKVAEILIKNYAVSSNNAYSICRQFLENFRKCPDNYPLDLDSWRQTLWARALGGHYEYLTKQIYEHWLKLRYEYLGLNQDTKKLLRSLRGECLLGLITNGPSNAQWEKVKKLDLKPFFDLILVSGDLPWEKPNEKIFLEACDILSVEPQHCIMVGDKLETDILGGFVSKFGGTVWIPLKDKKLMQCDPVPDYILRNVIDLPEILPQIRSDIRSTTNNISYVLSQDDLVTDIEDGNSNGSDGS